MKLALLKDENGNQALVVRIDEKPEGEAYVQFTETDKASDVARKLRDLADSIEGALNG
jgi:hypothetical protein